MNNQKYQVLCGNEYLKTSQVVIPFNVTQRGAYIEDCDEVVTMRHLRPLAPGQGLYSVYECLSKFYAKWNIDKLLSPTIKYVTTDGEDLTSKKYHDVRFNHIIFNNCKLNNVAFHSCVLTNVVFLNCDIDILDLRHAELNNVMFLHCDKTYAIKLDNAKLREVRFKKTSIPKDLKELGIEAVRTEQDIIMLRNRP
jgi:hypothetical protein